MVMISSENRIIRDIELEILDRLEREKYVESAVRVILDQAVLLGASDVLLEPGRSHSVQVKYRINGRFHPVTILPDMHAERILSRIKVLSGIPVYLHGKALEGRLEVLVSGRKVEMRASMVPAVNGERTVLRVLDPERLFKSMEDLGFDTLLSNRLENAIQLDQGLIVICGPTSSGKTTTLYAILDHIAHNQGMTRQIICIEDPVEFSLERIPQIEINDDAGFGVEQALKAVLRQDPEVIGIGEVRDPVTARMAVRAALTGHLVICTLHAGSPFEAPSRLRELGVDRRLLAGALSAILHQDLKHISCSCHPCPDAADATARPLPDCVKCLGTGIAGRKAFGNLLIPDAAFRRMIIDRIECSIKDES
jgi:type II secretory ATPase GspE/PulE/Tfp pilus assembly ATPase PilB-like protein